MRQIPNSTASMPTGSPDRPSAAQQTEDRYAQLAELEIDPSQLENYMVAIKKHIEMAVRTEPGVLLLCAVAHKDDPTHITIFEIYKNTGAYRAHLEALHFKDYKATTEKMVKSLKLIPVMPIELGAK
jgi:quinol monooxygenase YgiN